MSDKERIKKTIRDLLNLANNDAAFDLEAENALKFARKLMHRHNIDQSDLETLRDEHEIAAAADVEYGRKHCFSEAATLSWWERTLASVIADTIGTLKWYMETKMVRTTPHGTVDFRDGKKSVATRITFYGPAEDCADAIDLFDEWRQVIIAMARMKFGGVFRGKGRSYCEGFAAALWEKVTVMRDQEVFAIEDNTDKSYALMLRNSTAIMKAKREGASEWLEKTQGVKLRKGNSTSYRKHYAGAYKTGREDGRKSEVTRTRKKRLEG